MKKVIIVIALFAGLILITGLFMIVNGSLESFPTAEQIEKARIGGIVLAGLGAGIECVVIIIFSKLRKKDFHEKQNY